MIQVSIINQSEIKSLIKSIDVITAMEEGFLQYSNGNTVVPPVGELLFDNPKGEAHIKYGYVKGDDFYCVKIASGFYENSKFGISSSQGLMLLFSQKTGELSAILLDGGYLTNIRTAAAGALVARYFAPRTVNAIGIIGTGIQGRLQLQYLQQSTTCKNVWVWNKNKESALKFKEELGSLFDIRVAEIPSEVAQHCNLIVTATPSEIPLLTAEDIRPGTHITAVGADTTDKQELKPQILKKADLVLVDSISQSSTRGEVYRATKDGSIASGKAVELGVALQDPTLQRTNEKQITIADLTGVAVQDIMISKAVYKAYLD